MIANRTHLILKKYQFQMKKRFGQNFLNDSNIINKIIEVSNVNKECGIIEIGSGIGALTEALCINASFVLSYEIDYTLINILENELKFDNLKIINKDFLKEEIDYSYFKDLKRIIIVSNLPYYITSPLISKLLESDIKEIYVMVQKEFALRLVAKPNTKDYSSLTVLTNLNNDIKIEIDIPKNCFVPAPEVGSSFVSIKRVKNDYSANLGPNFKEFVMTIFNMRRKTLVNNILSKYQFKRAFIEEILVKLNLDINIRSESLTIDEIIKVYNNLNLNCI